MRPVLLATLGSGVTVLMVSAAMGDVIRDAAADDVTAGQALYESKCSGCHSLDADRIGPRHRNVVGRTIASISQYDYSPALQQLGGTWTAVRLDQFLSGTQQMAPGSKMYLELDDPAQRRLIIAYLQSVSRLGNGKR
jgi:cytochrome c